MLDCPRGWLYLEELRKSEIYSNIAFVALWIHDETEKLWNTGIHPAIYYAGFEPYRVDEDRKVEKIDNEIFIRIRESNFVISDFTGQRHNVYYEAGFAKGLGKKVIFTCVENEIDDVRFDIRQYSFILWNQDELKQLSKKLYYSIIENVGYGDQYNERFKANPYTKT